MAITEARTPAPSTRPPERKRHEQIRQLLRPQPPRYQVPATGQRAAAAAQTTDKTQTRNVPPHPGPFDAWANRLLANGSDITTARTTYRQALSDHEAGHRSR